MPAGDERSDPGARADQPGHPSNERGDLSFGEDQGVPFVVIESVEGRDLDSVVRDRGSIQVAQAIDWVVQAARWLEAAHARGIVHRDIKPGNLMLDRTSTVRVLDPAPASIADAASLSGKSDAGGVAERGHEPGTVDYMAPEQTHNPSRADHRADIYSLGCTLYYLLTGRPPFCGEAVAGRLAARSERPVPSLRVARPDVPPAIDAAFQKMVAERAEDRPASMTDVIKLLEASTATPAKAPASRELDSNTGASVSNKAARDRALPETEAVPSILVRRDEAERASASHELSLEDLVRDVRPAARAAPPKPQPLERATSTRSWSRAAPQPSIAVVVAATVALGLAIAGLVLSWRGAAPKPQIAKANTKAPERQQVVVSPPPSITTRIFDGSTGQGWMLCDRRAVPGRNIQPDGLNPHGTGSYLVVYHQVLTDFVLDFDYKLTKGCNSGVFLRVSDLTRPVQTGIEVSLDDTRHGDEQDSGGFYGLVAPTAFAQKPAGEWNHMTITVQGPRMTIQLNGSEVSSIDLDLWTTPGQRPDGSSHMFKNVAIGSMARAGYFGFQDLGADCWFKNIVLTRPAPSSRLH